MECSMSLIFLLNQEVRIDSQYQLVSPHSSSALPKESSLHTFDSGIEIETLKSNLP